MERTPRTGNSGAAAARTANRSLRAAIRRFRREEDGSLVIFGLFAFVMMLLLSGVALDLMRFEERRTRLQASMDRAVRAAAELRQTTEPREVVKEHFLKAGLTPPADEDIIVSENTSGDSVTVKLQTLEQLPTWFMGLAGIKELSIPVAATARQGLGQIEISLVLDVSGSMERNSRLVNLKPAAKSFVDRIFESAAADRVSISIVPYSTQVALSDDLARYFKLTGEHGYSNCIEFDEALGDFATTALQFGFGYEDRMYQRNGHFDPFHTSSPPSLLNCRNSANVAMMPFSGDREALKTHIEGLTAGGNASLDIGMKWGAALLDPSMQHVVDGMVTEGRLPSAFSERPYPFDAGEVLKIIVLMADGANTTEYRLKDEYALGDSRLYSNTWYQASDPRNLSQYSYYDPNRAGDDKYFSFRTGTWRSEPYGDLQGDKGEAVRMTWQEVWAAMSVRYFADEIVHAATGSTSERDFFRTEPVEAHSATKDGVTAELCALAKAQNVRIYTIAFEAPKDAQGLLRDCASADANYFAVAGRDIGKAFSGIANAIGKLRLTH